MLEYGWTLQNSVLSERSQSQKSHIIWLHSYIYRDGMNISGFLGLGERGDREAELKEFFFFVFELLKCSKIYYGNCTTLWLY